MKRPIVVNWWVKNNSNTKEKTVSKGVSYQIYQLLYGNINGKHLEYNETGVKLRDKPQY